MSTISTAKLKVSSEGAKGVAQQLDQVGKATDRVGRAQTRLGQASASAGRAFSAQASGLGGLVAAYAGAAATVFALQAAFDALNKAARAETIIQGTKTLALEIGQSGPRILKEIKSITQGQIELSEAAQNVNIALSAGFNTDQISRLTKVSLGASRALGRNLTDALQRVVRGAAKLEPELLDELGIFTRIDPAVNKYAQRLGVAASNLTDFERRQAFVNAVITEGERKFSAIDVSSKSTQKSLEQLQTQIQELALQFGQLIAKGLLPLVNFFKNDAGNTLLLFGGILSLVFGKALQIFTGFTDTSIKRFSAFADNIKTKSLETAGSLNKLTDGVSAFQNQFKSARPAFGALDARKSGAGLTREQISEAAQARTRFLEGGARSSGQRTQDIKTLETVRESLKKNSVQYKQTTAIIKTYTAANIGASLGARVAAASATFAAVSLKALGIAANFAATAINSIFAALAVVQLVGTLFDVDVLGKIKDAFKDTSQATRDLSQGIKGLALASVGGGAAFTKQIKSITDDAEILESIGDRIVAQNLKLVNQAAQVRSGGAADMAGEAATDVSINRSLVDTLSYREQATAALAKAEEERRKAEAANNQQAIIEYTIQENIIKALISGIERFGYENTKVIGELGRLSGLDTDKVAASFEEGAKGVERLNGKLIIAGVEIRKVNGQFSIGLSGLTKNQAKAVESQIIFNSVLKETTEAFERGAINSDKLSARLSGLRDRLIDIRETEAPEKVRELNDEIKELEGSLATLKGLEAITKGISKTFSGAFTALDTAAFTGAIGLSGQVAKNSEEAAKNQAEFLTSIIKSQQANAILVDSIGDVVDLNAKIQEGAQNFNLAIKAAAGSILQYYQTSQKVIQQEEVKTQQLQKQASELRRQAIILDQEINNKRLIEQEKQRVDLSKSVIDISTKSLELARAASEAKQKELEVELKIAAALAQNAAIRQRIDRTNRQTQVNANESARQLNQGILENQLNILEERSFKNQTEVNAKKREIIELERQYANERFAEQKALIDKELSDSLEQLQITKDIEESRLKGLEQQKRDLEKFNQEQLRIFDLQSKLEADKLKNSKDQLERERKIAFDKFQSQIKSNESDEAIFKAQSQTTLDQLKGYRSFAESVNRFLLATGDKSPFVQAVAEIIGVAQGKEAKDAFTGGLQAIPQKALTSINEAITAVERNLTSQELIFQGQRKNIRAQQLGEDELNRLRQSGLDQQITNTEILRSLERDLLAQSLAGKAKEIDAEIRLQQAKLDGIPLQELELRAQATQKIEQLEQTRIQTLEQLNQRIDAVARSEDRLGQALDQSQSIVRDSVTGAFMKLNDALIDGSITMDMVGNTFKDMVGNMLREIQQAVFRKTIVDPLTDIITGSIGGMFGGGSVGNAAATTIAVAQGGRVHMAQGGMPNAATMKRDRVPAMLEPGEFVMRKDAVKQFGLGTMMKMNAAPRGYQSGGIVNPGQNQAVLVGKKDERTALEMLTNEPLNAFFSYMGGKQALSLLGLKASVPQLVLGTLVGEAIEGLKGNPSKNPAMESAKAKAAAQKAAVEAEELAIRGAIRDAAKPTIDQAMGSPKGQASISARSIEINAGIKRNIEAAAAMEMVRDVVGNRAISGPSTRGGRRGETPLTPGSGGPSTRGGARNRNAVEGMAVPMSRAELDRAFAAQKERDYQDAFKNQGKELDKMRELGKLGGPIFSLDLAPLMESLGIGPQSSLAPTTGGIMNIGLFDSFTGKQSKSKQKSLADRFKGTSPRTKPQGVGSFFKGVYNSVADAVGLNTIATAGQNVRGFYSGASMIDDQGNIISGAPTAPTTTTKASSSGLLSESTIALANSLIGVEGLSATEAMSYAMSLADSRTGYNPRGNLAGALGATGVQFDLGLIPGIGMAVNFGRMKSGNQNLGRFQMSPKSIPTARQAATRVEVFNRTGVMATGNKLGFMEGDVTPSGNFMAAGKSGVVSGVDPFVGDKLGLDIATSRAIGNTFRASGTESEFATIGDFITAITTPGIQGRMTVEQYNTMSEQGRMGVAPALGGQRALSNYQRAQLSIYGGYKNNLGQTTIPGGRFSGTVASLTRGDFSDNFVSGIASGFSSDPGGGGGYGGVAGGSMGGISASGSDAFDALDSADFAGFAEEASGGLVRKMAAGGAVMSRDRVPALLEPGEFVIRRPMAKAIGGAALNQMNSTGKGMKAPDVQVNLSNEGAPKNVQAAAPRMDGGKIIIDMITRDMRNNGPIKKSLRK